MKVIKPALGLFLVGLVLSLGANAQNISIATGGTGGSVDNLKLVGSSNSYVGFSMADTGQDAYRGEDKWLRM